jgi:hypothetical protein
MWSVSVLQFPEESSINLAALDEYPFPEADAQWSTTILREESAKQ